MNSKILSFFYSNIHSTNKEFMIITSNLESFLLSYSLIELKIDSDGFCFLGAIKTFFQRVFLIESPLEYVKNKIIDYFLNNKMTDNNNLIEFDSIGKFKNDLNLFFEEKEYGNKINKYIISKAANIFEIDFYILNTHTKTRTNKRNKNLIIYLNANKKIHGSNAIILQRECFEDANKHQFFHYNLILSIADSIDTEVNDGEIESYLIGCENSLSASDSSDSLHDPLDESDEELFDSTKKNLSLKNYEKGNIIVIF